MKIPYALDDLLIDYRPISISIWCSLFSRHVSRSQL